MFQKVPALASVTAFACLGLAFTVGGCSSSAEPVGNAVTPDAGTPDAKPKTPPPTGGDDTGPEACGPIGDDATIAGMDAEFGWKPHASRQNACDTADLAAIQGVVDSGTAKSYLDFIQGTSAACQACAKSTRDSETWGPIVVQDAADTVGLANFGACYSAIDNPACGKAREYLQLCVNTTCSKCTGTEANTCVQDAVAKQCQEVFTAAQSSCTNAQADATCGNLLLGIKYLCAYEGADAGDGG